MTWDISNPSGTRGKWYCPTDIQELKQDLQVAFETGAFDAASLIYQFRGGKGNSTSRPATGEKNLYFNETKQELQRDTGSAWTRVCVSVAAGQKTFFYQSTAPLGWAIDATWDNRMILHSTFFPGSTNDSWSGTASTATADHYHLFADGRESGAWDQFLKFYFDSWGGSDYIEIGSGEQIEVGTNDPGDMRILLNDTVSDDKATSYSALYGTQWTTHSHTISGHTATVHPLAKGIVCAKS